ncbi:DUF6993 domain-containing protein [Agrococcus citreus]|uniref:DUF6993 domain-containing protein n=1 Tax=Agrococcus citreus TaxID=84643 RepID=A0ABP4JBG2_9MICO
MRRSAASALLAAALFALLLAGCTAADPDGTGDPDGMGVSGASDAPAVTAAPSAAADQALDNFLAAIAGHSPNDPDALVAAVEAAGFPSDAIERTREVDSLGAPVTFLEIAVLDGDSCIVGQVGDGEPIAMRASPLGGGRCLVGEIVTVD